MFSTHSRKTFLQMMLAASLLCVGASCGDEGDDDKGESQQEYGPKGGRIYATVSATNEVLVYDDATHERVDQYAVGVGPAIILARADYKKLYTANWGDNTVSAIDVAGDTVKNIPVDGRPYVIAIDPAGKRLYAGLSSTQLAVIDTETDSVIASYPMQELPASIIVSADGKTLYVAFLGLGVLPGSMIAVDAETGATQKPALPMGLSPAWITMTPDGRKVYSLNFLSDDITVIDTASWKVDTTIKVGPGTQGIIANPTPDSKLLYVTNHGTSDFVAIDTSSNAVVQQVQLNGRPVGVAVSPDGQRVYTTDFGPASKQEQLQVSYLLTGKYEPSGNGQLSVFSVATGEPIGPTIEVGPGPTSVVVAPAP